MNEQHNSHHRHEGSNPDYVHRPYWSRAHRDWRVWVGVVLMLAAMIIYIMSEDLTVRPGIQPPPISSAVGK